MLILTRRTGEEIDITVPGLPPIVITVLGVKGNQVRIGVLAPKNVTIDRAEITARKNIEKQMLSDPAAGNR